MKKIKIDMTNGIVLITIITLLINFYMKNYSDKKENFNQNSWISINSENFMNNIEESDEINKIEKIITENCNNEKDCEIKNIFDYVKNIPYMENENKIPKYPIEVISSNSGDCDEKSFLMASLLKVKNYQTILVICKNKSVKHMFVAVNEKNKKEKKTSYIKIGNENYYIAETTDKNSYIGKFNGIEKNDYIGIYNINTKKTINISNIKLIKNI